MGKVHRQKNMSKATYVVLTLLLTLLVTVPGCGRKDRSDDRDQPQADPAVAPAAETSPAAPSPGPASQAGIQAPDPASLTWQGHDLEDSPIGFDALGGFAVQAGKHGDAYYANQHAGPIALTVRYGKNVTLTALQEYWERDKRFRPGPVEAVEVCGVPGKRQITTREEIAVDPSKLLNAEPFADRLGYAERSDSQAGSPGGSPGGPSTGSSGGPAGAPDTAATPPGSRPSAAPVRPVPPPGGAPKRVVPARTITVLAAEHAGQTLVATWTLPSALREQYAAAEAHFLASLRCR